MQDAEEVRVHSADLHFLYVPAAGNCLDLVVMRAMDIVVGKEDWEKLLRKAGAELQAGLEKGWLRLVSTMDQGMVADSGMGEERR